MSGFSEAGGPIPASNFDLDRPTIWGAVLDTIGGDDDDKGPTMDVLKVSSRSSPSSVAGAMAGAIRQRGVVEVQVVGAGALNQAIKAVAVARGYLTPSGYDIVCIPTFADILIDGESRTALRLVIEDRNRSHASVALTVDLRGTTEPANGSHPEVAEPAEGATA